MNSYSSHNLNGKGKHEMEVYPRFLKQKYSQKNLQEGLFIIPGVLANIVLTKNHFKNNKDIEIFTKEILNKNYKEYLFQNRNALYARIIRDILDAEVTIQLQLINNVLKFIFENHDDTNKPQIKNRPKKKKSIIQSWSEIIDPK